jgi:glutathione S-transferase kappa 1
MCRCAKKWNISLELKPFLLGGIMQGSDNRPPGMVPMKGAYLQKDLSRMASYYQIPLKPPANVAEVMFEKGSLASQRLLTVVKLTCHDKLEELSRQLWIRIWSQDKDITKEDSLIEACKMAGISEDVSKQLLSSISDQTIKDKLKEVTQEALELGAFGSPFIVATVNGKDEVFFGSDRFELLAYVIGEKWEGPMNELKAKY